MKKWASNRDFTLSIHGWQQLEIPPIVIGEENTLESFWKPHKDFLRKLQGIFFHRGLQFAGIEYKGDPPKAAELKRNFDPNAMYI